MVLAAAGEEPQGLVITFSGFLLNMTTSKMEEHACLSTQCTVHCTMHCTMLNAI